MCRGMNVVGIIAASLVAVVVVVVRGVCCS